MSKVRTDEQSVGSDVYGFDAIRGIQAEREFYVAMCPLKIIPKIFIFDDYDLPPELRAQRTLRKARIPAIKNYILNNSKDYTFSSLAASVDGKMKFTPSLGSDGKLGRLYINMDSRFLINDGQHRRKAIEEALKVKPELGHEMISVVFFRDDGLKRSQQMFSDLNKNAVKPTKSLNILYDNRDDFSKFIVNLVNDVEVFQGRVELEKTTISNRSGKVFTLNGIADASMHLLGLTEGEKLSKKKKILVKEFWETVSKNMPEWQMILQDSVSLVDLRKHFVNTNTNLLNALGIAGKIIIKDSPETWKTKLKNLKKIDWSRENPEWDGRLLRNGQMTRLAIGIDLAANVIVKKCKVKLDKTRQKIEAKLMSESILEKRTIADVLDEIRDTYLNDDRPWIIGFSGGKDSTCLVQLVWKALSKLPQKKLQKEIHVISSDTLVEAPQIAERITGSLERMEKCAKKINLPLGTNLLRPPITDTFWVRLLGMGYPAPTTMFRWCTDMLKISNADRFIKDTVSKHGEAIVLLGMRKSESSVRDQVMNMYKIENSVLSRHSKFDQTYVYTPIENFSSEDVWNYLLANKNPWGDENRNLLAMYQDANASECPLVIDTTTPSCGGGRFGCWTCTVVDKQSYLTNLIESDEKNEWMEVLAELRQKLKDTQDSSVWEIYRERKRRNGNVDLKSHGEGYTPGPYKMEFRIQYLKDLLKGQIKIQKLKDDPEMELILEDEIREIQRIWRMEQGDWKNTAYAIYAEITGRNLNTVQNELGNFGNTEQNLLEETCSTHNVPFKLVSSLLNLELKSQGANRHVKIFDKIRSELSKEWRDVNNAKEFEKIIVELQKKKDIRDKIKTTAKSDAKKTQ